MAFGYFHWLLYQWNLHVLLHTTKLHSCITTHYLTNIVTAAFETWRFCEFYSRAWPESTKKRYLSVITNLVWQEGENKAQSFSHTASVLTQVQVKLPKFFPLCGISIKQGEPRVTTEGSTDKRWQVKSPVSIPPVLNKFLRRSWVDSRASTLIIWKVSIVAESGSQTLMMMLSTIPDPLPCDPEEMFQSGGG